MRNSKLSKNKILFITSTRADYSLQKKLIELFSRNSNYEVFLLITGSHLSKNYGLTKNEINIDNCKLIFLKLSLSKDSSFDISKLFANYLIKINKLISLHKFNLSILIGDRYEILSAAISLNFNNIPIVHLHGGETTLGSKDNNYRNMISHLSEFHFVSHNIHKKKLISLGIPSKNIFNFGAFCSDNLNELQNINLDSISKKLGINLTKKKFFLFTYHPESLRLNDELKNLRTILNILKKFKEINFIITASNHETFSLKINRYLISSAKKIKNLYFFHSLGSTIYLNLLRNSSGIIGNSSSGVIEAPYFKVPTINIGLRQEGRYLHKSILNCKYNFIEIEKNIKKSLNRSFRKKLLDMKNTLIKDNVSMNSYNKLITKYDK